jgi:uroporphyrin-III C-methyltransferase
MTAAVVHLVGAGPGDPLLLTRRAARLLGAADVVVADRPSIDAVMALAPVTAVRQYVGRTRSEEAWSLEAIVDLLAGHARAGRSVVRLKSGDPFICSRGAEEVAALAARGVSCEVTPGVTSATVGPLAAGAPRGRTITVASGDDDPAAAPVPWAALADPTATLVVRGRAPGTPTWVVHAAGRSGTRVAPTRLAALGSTRLPPPALVVVGPDPEVGRAHP